MISLLLSYGHLIKLQHIACNSCAVPHFRVFRVFHGLKKSLSPHHEKRENDLLPDQSGDPDLIVSNLSAPMHIQSSQT